MRNLLKFKTKNFSFNICNFSKEELLLLQELEHDDNTKKYVSEYYQYILETKHSLENQEEIMRYTLIVFEKDKPIALVSLFESYDELVYSVVVRPSLRGKGYSNRIRDELFNYVYKNNLDIKNIVGYVDSTNTNSLKSINKSDFDKIEKMYDKNENKVYYKVIRNNPYYKNKHRGSR